MWWVSCCRYLGDFSMQMLEMFKYLENLCSSSRWSHLFFYSTVAYTCFYIQYLKLGLLLMCSEQQFSTSCITSIDILCHGPVSGGTKRAENRRRTEEEITGRTDRWGRRERESRRDEGEENCRREKEAWHQRSPQWIKIKVCSFLRLSETLIFPVLQPILIWKKSSRTN